MIDLPTDYRPDTALHPGRFLMEHLHELGMTQSNLAKRMQRPPQVINQIIREKKSITPETALELEKVLGVDAQFWTNLQSIYDLVTARRAEDANLESRDRGWLKRFPVKHMAELGWLDVEREDRASHKLRELLKFFAIPSFDALEPTVDAIGFRVTERAKVDEWALRAWLRQGERVALARDTASFQSKKFEAAITEIRSLTNDDPQVFAARMKQLCAEAGVALVMVPHVPKTGANGVARWLGPSKAMIQLNLRYKWADIFWFTFFHEAAHVLQRETKRTFVDLTGDERRNEAEDEADAFARETLIPRLEWEPFVESGNFSTASILNFAINQQLHPGIVVGRLQREGHLLYRQRNELKQRLEFVTTAT